MVSPVHPHVQFSELTRSRNLFFWESLKLASEIPGILSYRDWGVAMEPAAVGMEGSAGVPEERCARLPTSELFLTYITTAATITSSKKKTHGGIPLFCLPSAPWHFRNFRPLPQGQGSFLPGVAIRVRKDEIPRQNSKDPACHQQVSAAQPCGKLSWTPTRLLSANPDAPWRVPPPTRHTASLQGSRNLEIQSTNACLAAPAPSPGGMNADTRLSAEESPRPRHPRACLGPYPSERRPKIGISLLSVERDLLA